MGLMVVLTWTPMDDVDGLDEAEASCDATVVGRLGSLDAPLPIVLANSW